MHNCRCYYLIRKAKRFFRLFFYFWKINVFLMSIINQFYGNSYNNR